MTRAGTPLGPSSEHDGFSSCGLRDLKVASRTSRTTLLALQVSAEQSVGWMTAMPSSPPIRPIQIGPQRCGQNFDRRFLSTQELGLTCLESVERAIMLLTALKPGRMGAERARLLNKEQRRPFVVRSEISQIISCVLRHQLNGKNPSRYLRGSRPLKGTALRAGPRWLHPS